MLALIERSRPGDWDVFVVGNVDMLRAVEAAQRASVGGP